MVILALDVGAKRIGTAVSDDLGILASPRDIIQRTSNAQAIEAIARLVRETEAAQVLVGLPISFDGTLHAQARAVQVFAARLQARINVPLLYVDETLSTVRAYATMRAAGMRPERMRQRVDAVAAAVILQDYLDHRQTAQPASSGATERAANPGAVAAGDGWEAAKEGQY